MAMPKLRVRSRRSYHYFQELPIRSRDITADASVGHQAVGLNADARSLVGLLMDLFKSRVLGRLLKLRQATHPLVQDVVG